MPTRKQRRRDQKNRRHDWEYVYVDGDGQEVDVDPAALRAQKEERRSARDAAPANGKGKSARPGRVPRAAQPPSWTRAAKRAAMLGGLFIVVFGFLGLRGKHHNVAGAVVIGVVYAILFIPLQYFLDRVAYRSYLKRQAKAAGAKR